jgi:hypothetical protein
MSNAVPNPYLVQTGTLLQYPYYDKHSDEIIKEQLDQFKPKWNDSFDEFFTMAMNINQQRTYSFLQECQNLQQKAKDNALTTEEVNHFKHSLDNFFTRTDDGSARTYISGHKISMQHHPGDYEKNLWKFAKAAVALYEHCQEIISLYSVETDQSNIYSLKNYIHDMADKMKQNQIAAEKGRDPNRTPPLDYNQAMQVFTIQKIMHWIDRTNDLFAQKSPDFNTINENLITIKNLLNNIPKAPGSYKPTPEQVSHITTEIDAIMLNL